MKTKIEPISKIKTVDYSNELLLNFWKQKTNIHSHQNHKSELVKVLQSPPKEGIVCLQTESLTDKNLIKLISEIAQSLKVRFYILVNAYSQELDALNEICLIRYELKNKGSFILVNPNLDKSQGIFFTGQLTEQSIVLAEHISKMLDATETKELFRHFCYHFWETAKKEVIEKGLKTNVAPKTLNVSHNTKQFGEKDFVFGTLFDFVGTTKRSELSNKPIIYLNQETQVPILIKPNSRVNCGENVSQSLVPKNEFEELEPILEDDGVSVCIEYHWKNVPFYLPEKAISHSLYEQWKNKTAEIVKALDTVLVKIQEVEKKETSISQAITRFFLGKKTVFRSLKTEIEGLKETDFANLTETKLKEKINHINELNAQVQTEIVEIETKDHKAKLDEEIEKLTSEVSEKEVDLEIKKQELAAKNKDKEQKLDDFLLNNNIEKGKINAQKGIWEQQAGKKNKEKNPQEANIAEEKLRALKEIENHGFISKTESEINDIDKKIKSLKNQIGGKEKEKNKQVQQTSSSSLYELVDNKSLKQNNLPTSQLVPMPNLHQLPTRGQLFQLSNQSFLAIEFWEDYKQGKEEAKRLNAILCAIKN